MLGRLTDLAAASHRVKEVTNLSFPPFTSSDVYTCFGSIFRVTDVDVSLELGLLIAEVCKHQLITWLFTIVPR